MDLCKECNSGCCRRFLVYLMGNDIIRICQTLQMDFSVFVDAVPVPESKIQLHLDNRYPMFLFKETGDKQYFVLALKSTDSILYPDASKCLFLLEFDAQELSNGTVPYKLSRCGIHACRPSTCRTFPAVYYPEEGKVKVKDPFLLIENEHSKYAGKEPYKLCARPLTKDDFNKFTEGYVKDTVIDIYENEFFLQVVEKWNKNPGISDELYGFLVKEYRNRIDLVQ